MLILVSDPDFNGVDVKELLAMQVESPYRSFMFVVDQTTLSHPDRPILVIDSVTEPGGFLSSNPLGNVGG